MADLTFNVESQEVKTQVNVIPLDAAAIKTFLLAKIRQKTKKLPEDSELMFNYVVKNGVFEGVKVTWKKEEKKTTVSGEKAKKDAPNTPANAPANV